MKQITVQLRDIKGNIVEENQVEIEEQDILVMKYPQKMTLEQTKNCYNGLLNALETGKTLIGMPESINFEVINIK